MLQTLKPAVTAALLALLAPIQADFETSSWQDLTPKANLPPEVKIEDKKDKDKRGRHAGRVAAAAAAAWTKGACKCSQMEAWKDRAKCVEDLCGGLVDGLECLHVMHHEGYMRKPVQGKGAGLGFAVSCAC